MSVFIYSIWRIIVVAVGSRIGQVKFIIVVFGSAVTGKVYLRKSFSYFEQVVWIYTK